MRNARLVSWLCAVIVSLSCLFIPLGAQGAGDGNDIRRIDFKNFSYNLGKSSCAEMLHKSEVKVRNGAFGESSDVSFRFEVDSDRTVFGDLTGDGIDEAVVVTYCGGMHPIEQAFIYTMKKGRAVLLARLEEGNRAFGGMVRSHLCQGCGNGLEIQNGLLIVERMHGDAACCPKYIETKTFRWNGKKLVQAGPSRRKPFIEKR